jgi:hypothetical protein
MTITKENLSHANKQQAERIKELAKHLDDAERDYRGERDGRMLAEAEARFLRAIVEKLVGVR